MKTQKPQLLLFVTTTVMVAAAACDSGGGVGRPVVETTVRISVVGG